MAEELETIITQDTQPDWWTALQRDLNAGMANVFVLFGNASDYVEHPRTDYPLRQYLEARLGRTHTVVSFAPDQGVTFPGNELAARESRARFDQVLGRQAAAPAAPGAFDPVAAMRAATGGAFGGGSDQADLPSDAPSALGLLVDLVRRASVEDPLAPKAIVGSGDNRRVLPKRTAVIVDRADLIVPPEDKARLGGADRALLARLYRAGSDIEINQRSNLIILLAPSLEEIHPDLRLAMSGIRPIEVRVPDHAQRLAYVVRSLEQRRVTLADDLTEQTVASELAGLNRRHIEDVTLRAVAAGRRLTRDLVRDRKTELIKAEYAEVLEVLEPDVTFAQIGGHERVLRFLKRRVLRPMLDPDLRHRCPMGLLFAGPSGTGKTYVCRALGHESGYAVVGLAADKIRGSFVGESEQKLSKAIRGIRALAPCIVFIDEIDVKVRRPSGGGGGGDSVEGNIFGKLLEFFSEESHRGEILLIAATNRPDQIDAAFKRPGRIDHQIPLLPPDSAQERASALAALTIDKGVTGLTEAELLAIGEQTDLWTQAELGALVGAAGALIDLDDLDEPEPDDDRSIVVRAFAQALEEQAPSTADVELHTDLAIRACNNRSLVPDRYRDRVGKQVAKSSPSQQTAPIGTARRGTAIDVAAIDDFADFDEEEVAP